MKKKQELVYGIWAIVELGVGAIVLFIAPIPALIQGDTSIHAAMTGFGLGLFCLVAAAYFLWERHREKQFNTQQEQEELAQANRQ